MTETAPDPAVTVDQSSTAAVDRTPVIELDQVSVQYRRANEPSLISASLSLHSGELIVVAGPSGSGKSTLLRVLNGLVPRSYRAQVTGTVRIGGVDAEPMSLRDISETVGTLLQDPGKQVVGQTVLAELAFGLENRGVAPAEIDRRCRSVADRLQIEHLLDRAPRELSGGQLQLVAFAGILVLEPRVVVVDEPLANLDPDAAATLLSALRDYVDNGGAAIVVEHRVDEVMTLAPDRVIATDEGQITYHGPAAEFLARADPAAIKLGFDSLLQHRWNSSDLASARVVPRASHADDPSVRVRLRYQQADLGYPERSVLRGISTEFVARQQVAVIGPNGAGKSTLLKAAVGSVTPAAGEVHWEAPGLDLRPAHLLPAADLVSVCGYVFQNPAQALFCESVGEELSFGPRHLGVDESEIVERVRTALMAVGLDQTPDIEQRPPRTLSFGQQRRLAVAVALTLKPKTLILDEPTAGQDLRSARHFLDAILDLDGVQSQYLITHDLELALSRSDRVLVVDDGAIVADASPAEIVADRALWHHENDQVHLAPLRENAYIRAARTLGPSIGRLPDPVQLAIQLASAEE